MRILLLSAYDATSHRQWRKGLVEQLCEHDWTVLTLAPRYFSWRLRGNALSWFAEQHEVLNAGFDLILATSMVDLATLRGIVPGLAATPAILYFHENQFAYPDSGNAHPSIEAQITSIYSALSADLLLYNSAYNRDSFLSGAGALLKKMPDHAPLTALDGLSKKSKLLPVPLDDTCFSQHERELSTPITLLWNHRWEYDKGPDRLLLLMEQLEHTNLDYRIHIAGQQFRQQPDAFAQIRSHFAQHIGSWGYIEDRDHYLQLLQQADIAISTALHDFQGLALLEAVAAGAMPVAPNRLAYPEFFDPENLYTSHPDDPQREAAAAAEMIVSIANGEGVIRTDLSRFAWRNIADRYRTAISESVR